MKYSKARRHVYLIPLHVCGFISIPNFHRYPWMNKLHNNVYRKYLCVVFVVAVSLQVASTFIHAIQDLPEFLQRLYESALVSSCVVDFVFYNTRLNQIIELFDLQEEVFKVTNKKIHRKYLKMEFYEVGMFLVFCILMLVGLLSQTFLPRSDENLNLIRTLYRRKYPTRILPFNMWTPSFIDVSEMKYFVILYFFDVYGLVVILTLVFERILLQIVFPTSLLGQYEMLAEFVKLIGAEHRDKYGESIFYTDIAHGTYITETQILERIGNDMTEISKQDAILKLKQWTKNNYPDFYFQRINRRQQELDYVMVKYRRYAVTFYSFIFLPLLILWLLAFYQMAYMSHLPMFNFFKITMEFLLTLLNYFHLTTQSERLNSCNERIAQAITQCSWYNCSPAMRKKIGVFVNSVRRSRRLCLLGNSVRLSKPNLLRILRMAFSFVNFMRIENRL